VTGQNLTISIINSITKAGGVETAIIVGIIGKSALIDSLVSSKTLDVSKIKGMRMLPDTVREEPRF